MSRVQRAPTTAQTGYESDYAAWLESRARYLRAGRLQRVDVPNLAVELEDLGRSEGRALESHLKVLPTHLWKRQFQSDRRTASWRLSIDNARDAVVDIAAESPSLKEALTKTLAPQYRRARRDAATGTGLAEATFPKECQFSADEILGSES